MFCFADLFRENNICGCKNKSFFKIKFRGLGYVNDNLLLWLRLLLAVIRGEECVCGKTTYLINRYFLYIFLCSTAHTG